MLLLPSQADKGIGLTKSLKKTLNKHLPNNVKTQVRFTGQNLSTQLMLRIGSNLNTEMTLFILVNVQKRIILIIILVNIPGESSSGL